MIVAQISDLHVVAPGRLCMGRVPTNDYLRLAVEHLDALRPRPDAVVVSGDLTERGAPEEYAQARRLLDALPCPYFVVPGNHDDRAALLEAFSDHAYLPARGAPWIQYAVDAGPLRLVGLDTHVPGASHGELCDARLAWLDATLAAETIRPTLIFMHHPPFSTGIKWIDAYGLAGARRAEAIVARHGNVERVLCGHVHRSIQTRWGGTIASTVPSVSHQVALDLAEPRTWKARIVAEPRAVLLHVYEPGRGVVSHTSYVGDAEELYVDLSPDAVESVKREYEALRACEADRAT